MLKSLPTILSQISQNFDLLFLFYSLLISNYSCNFHFINDNNVHNAHADYYTGE